MTIELFCLVEYFHGYVNMSQPESFMLFYVFDVEYYHSYITRLFSDVKSSEIFGKIMLAFPVMTAFSFGSSIQ